MEKGEAAKVLTIMLTADSWCSTCQSDLFEQFAEAFPEHAGLATEVLSRSGHIQAALVAAREQREDAGAYDTPDPKVWQFVRFA